jgi:uncharacterized membrane protein YjgN (DUF898 family)
MDIAEAGDAKATVASPLPNSAEYTGTRLEIFKKALKYTILTILTFGFYRFLAKTKMRRYIWSNVRVGGAPFEYTGTAMELFIGFLVAVACLVPLGVLGYLIEVWIEAGRPTLAQVGDLIFTLAIGLLIPFALYRLWRYRLSRSLWRGVRFGLDGSAIKFVQIAFGYGVLTVLTAWIAYPWMKIALIRYRLNNTHYGQTHFAFDGRGRGILKPWLVLYFSIITGFVLLFFVFPLSGDGGVVPSSPTPEQDGAFGLFGRLGILFLILAVIYVWYRVQVWRYMVSATSFAGATAASTFQVRAVIGSAIIVIVGLAGMAGLIVFAIDSAYGIGDGGLFPTEAGVFLFIISAIVLSSIARAFIYATLFHDVLKHGCATLKISDLAPFEMARQSADHGPSRGEGFADALDVGAF